MRLDRFRSHEDTPLVPLAAMIDVLFLMIIFLVLGASFEPIASVRLPQASGGETQRETLRLELRRDRQIWFQGRPHGPQEVEQALRRANPAEVLLLPDGQVDVETLFLWHERIGKMVQVPVSVGVRPPAP